MFFVNKTMPFASFIYKHYSVRMHRFFIIYVTSIFAGLIGFSAYVYGFMPRAQWDFWASESSLSETGSVFFFGLCAFLSLIVFFADHVRSWLFFAILMALAAMREMDWHKAWTTDSILKSNFYKSMDTPIIEKIIGGLVILLLLYMAYYFVRRLPWWIRNLWRFQEQAWAIGLGLGCLVVAKSLDSMARWFPFLADFHAQNRVFLGVIEENLEMTGSLFFILVCLYGLSPLVRRGH